TDRSGWYYQANWMNALSLDSDTRIQLDTHFVGPKVLTQGREKSYVYFDLAIRQQLFKSRLTLSLVAHDVFHTARYYNTRETEGLSSVTRVRPKYPNIVASVSYNFNASRHKAAVVTGGNLFEGKEF
ncbi:MAG: outer membrane beta-barrel protein, partial [Bacteroidaceae bacterium]|nr:outer membrane beta-barrel protein [Bacteroidaceae bacterium]